MTFSTRIHPADEMHRFELAVPHRTPEAANLLYFATGRQIFEAVAGVVAWRFQGFGGVRSLLDFASGYGRSTRFLVEALAPGKITVAEIDPAAVRFQEETFGVRGAAAGPEPESLALDGSFDVVVASSFFSHLPAARFEAWLARLYALVAGGGVLIFSAHGMGLLPEGEPMEPSGIVFRPVSETQRLEGTEYGTSYVSPEFVRRVGGARGRVRTRASSRCPTGCAAFRTSTSSAGLPFRRDRTRARRSCRGARSCTAPSSTAASSRGAGPWATATSVRPTCGCSWASVSPRCPRGRAPRAPGGTGVSRSPWRARTRTRSCASRP